jgi:hypothetical protein
VGKSLIKIAPNQDGRGSKKKLTKKGREDGRKEGRKEGRKNFPVDFVSHARHLQQKAKQGADVNERGKKGGEGPRKRARSEARLVQPKDGNYQ